MIVALELRRACGPRALFESGEARPVVIDMKHRPPTGRRDATARAYADFIARKAFSYPGELGGPPPPVMRHDCCHVLGGHGTTPSEECAVVAFQAGFEKAGPFFVLMFAIAQFELGIGSSPFLPGMKRQADPEMLLAGLEHGAQVNRDLIGDASWDPWEHFGTPLSELRASLGIAPRGREAEYPATAG